MSFAVFVVSLFLFSVRIGRIELLDHGLLQVMSLEGSEAGRGHEVGESVVATEIL